MLENLGMHPIWFGTASELKRPYLGETEKELISRFNCSKKLPHLLCCIVIDEIDTLTKRRTCLRNETGTDLLSVMLRIIGSVDYENVLLIGSTNLKTTSVYSFKYQ